MFYLSAPIKTPKFIVLWVFLFLVSLYLFFTKQHFNILLPTLIFLHIALLYIMFYLYKNYVQGLIQNSVLQTKIVFKKINLAMSFKEPYIMEDIVRGNMIVFYIYLHNNYYKDDYPYITALREEIRYNINSVWKHAILYYNKLTGYLVKILVYCFVFGILLLLLSIISYEQFDYIGDKNIYQKLYIFFTFLSFSFWLYITIIILFSESIIKKYEDNRWQYEIYTSYNNLCLNPEQIAKLTKKSDNLDNYIQLYISIASTILYIGFLTILAVVF